MTSRNMLIWRNLLFWYIIHMCIPGNESTRLVLPVYKTASFVNQILIRSKTIDFLMMFFFVSIDRFV